MPRLITATLVARPMSDVGERSENNMLEILIKPSTTLANWYFWVGLLGLMLAVLNILGLIHPTYRVSWGGLFTFEYTNQAFGAKDDAAALVASDLIFIALAGSVTFLGARSLIGDGTPAEWLNSLATSKWYNDLFDFEAGWNLVLGTWLMVASMVFYFYWGIMYLGWIDPGVYSISISLMGLGLVLRMFASIDSDE